MTNSVRLDILQNYEEEIKEGENVNSSMSTVIRKHRKLTIES